MLQCRLLGGGLMDGVEASERGSRGERVAAGAAWVGATTAAEALEGTNRLRVWVRIRIHQHFRRSKLARKGCPAWAPKAGSRTHMGGKAARRAFSKERQEERLAKILAAAGVASRRASEEIIFAGRVTVNGIIERSPQCSIYVDGRSLPKREPDRLYFCLNKPKGYICTSSTKEGGSRRVVDLFDEWLDVWMEKHPGGMRPRLFTVGRLDVQTTGLLLVTNDGDWAQEVMHPSSGVTKEYIATTDVPPTRRQLATIEQGCEASRQHCSVDGAFVKPVYVGLVEQDPRSASRVVIEVADGRNREVRRLIENAGLQAIKLKRTRIGGLRLSRKLLPGQFTAIYSHEVKQVLNKAAQSSFATTIVPH
eukprot:jgi/Chlat1/6661/Chrsp49S06129